MFAANLSFHALKRANLSSPMIPRVPRARGVVQSGGERERRGAVPGKRDGGEPSDVSAKRRALATDGDVPEETGSIRGG